MSQTIGQLDPGTIVALEYNDQLEDWIIMESNSNRTILLRKTLLPSKRMHSSNVAIYNGCEMDVYLEGTYLDGFSDAFKTCLTATNIQTYTYGDAAPIEIARRCFLASQDNLFANNEVESETSWISVLRAVTGATSGDNARIGRDANGTAQFWWLRSPGSAAQFRIVSTSGTASYYNATNSFYLRPAISVASDTMVTDNDSGIIRVIPDEEHRYRRVSCIGYLGERVNNPKSARVIYNTNNLIDVSVEVSNNAKDTNPIWVDATDGEPVEFNNETCETDNFVIGIKLSGKSETIGWFNEPAILLQEE